MTDDERSFQEDCLPPATIHTKEYVDEVDKYALRCLQHYKTYLPEILKFVFSRAEKLPDGSGYVAKINFMHEAEREEWFEELPSATFLKDQRLCIATYLCIIGLSSEVMIGDTIVITFEKWQEKYIETVKGL